jgi:hypothetical protein
MKTNLCAITTLALSCLAGAASAQDTYVSGILHQPAGSAQFGPVDGRRLPVQNLGSSGQDGVEIQLNSAYGGGGSLDLQPFLFTAGATYRVRYRGWDGLVYGNHRITSNGSGGVTLHFDYTSLGATSVTVAIYDHNGTQTGGGTYDGGTVDQVYQPNFTCPPGMYPVVGVQHVRECNTCPWIDVYGWYCGGQFYSNEFIVVTPHFAAGTPDQPGVTSMILTGSGMPSMTVSDANLDTFGVKSYGVGQAVIDEECTPDASTGVCDPNVRRLPVRNLGSSGQDGVAIDLGDNAGGVSVQMTKACCPGHVILIKLTDDAGQEQRVAQSVTDMDPTGATTVQLDADFSALGANGYLVKCFGADGTTVGPAGGYLVLPGTIGPVLHNPCPPGSVAIWTQAGPNYPWVFQGCSIINAMVLPNGTVVQNVASYSLTPNQPTHTQGRLRHVVITKNGSELELRNVVVTAAPPPCGTADFNGDGAVGTDADIEAFFACLGGACCPTCDPHGADFNGDGAIGTDADIESFFRVLGGGPC